MVPRNQIVRADKEGNRHGGLYPLLESVFGPNLQDLENSDTRFSAFTDGHSQIGTQFEEAFNLLRLKAPGEAPGPLPRPLNALRLKYSKKSKTPK